MARFLIEVAFESGGIDRARKRTREYGKDTSTAGKAVGRLKADLAGMITAGLGIAGVTAAWGAFRRVLDAVGRLAGESVQLFAKQEKADRQLEAALRSTSGVIGLTVSELKQMASGLQAVTTIGDETIEGAQAMLLTFTGIGKDVFPAVLESALDLSTRFDQDLRSSVVQLGKALNAPIENLGALGRTGIQFSESQKETIKQLASTNRLAEAQALILEELQVQFGGSARAARDTLGGALESLGNTVGDLKESLGSGLAPTITAVANALTGELANAFEAAGGAAGGLDRRVSSTVLGLEGMALFLAALIDSVLTFRERVKGLSVDLSVLVERMPMLGAMITALRQLQSGVEVEGGIGEGGPTVQRARKFFEDLRAEIDAARAAAEDAGAAIGGMPPPPPAVDDGIKKIAKALEEEIRQLEGLERAQELGGIEGELLALAIEKGIDPTAELSDGLRVLLMRLLELRKAAGVRDDLEALEAAMEELAAAQADAAGQLEEEALTVAAERAAESMGEAYEAELEQAFASASQGMGEIFADGVDAMDPVWHQMGVNLRDALGEAALIAAQTLVDAMRGAEVDLEAVFESIGQLAGAAIGGAFGGPGGAAVGGIIGGALGGMLGGSLQGGPDVIGSLQLVAGEAVAAFGELNEAMVAINAELEAIERLTGGAVTLTESISVRVKDNGEVWLRLGDELSMQVGSVAEALDLATAFLIRTAEFTGVPEQVLRALENTTARTLDELAQDIGFAMDIARLDMGPVKAFFFDLFNQVGEEIENALRLGLDPAPLLARLREDLLDAFRTATSPGEHAELAAVLEQERARLQVELEAAQNQFARIQEQLASFGALGAEFGFRLVQNLQRQAAELAGLIAALEGQLAALPVEIPAFTGGGGGGTRRRGRESIREEVAGLEESLLGGLGASLHEVAAIIPDLAERIYNLGFSSEEAAALIARAEAVVRERLARLAADVISEIEGLGGAQEGLLADLDALDEKFARLQSELLMLADAGAITSEQFGLLQKQLAQGISAEGLAAVSSEAQNLLLRAFDFLGRQDDSARLRFELERAQLLVAIEELRLAQERLGLELAIIGELTGLAAEIAEMEFVPSADVPIAPPAPPAFGPFNSALEDAAREAERLQRAFERARDGIREFLLDITTGSFGGVAPEQALAAARAEFESILAAARGGDLEALEALPAAGRRFLELLRGFSPAAFGLELPSIMAALEELLGLQTVNTQGNVAVSNAFGSGSRLTLSPTLESGLVALTGESTRQTVELKALRHEMRELRLTQDQLNRRAARQEARQSARKTAGGDRR